MAPHPAAATHPALEQLQHALLTASDEQLGRILRLLDRLEKRGNADTLIAPIRRRLTSLRPARPLTFDRLLFTPADPLVMAGPQWSRGRLGLPRTALAPLGAQVRAGLGTLAAEVEAMIRDGHVGDAAVVERAGALLWPAAAAVLDRAGPPPGWAEATGLGGAEHAAIARCAAGVLAEATWIQASLRASAEGLGPDPDDMRIWLEAAMTRHPEPPGALLAVLMVQLPGAVALIAPSPSQPLRSAAHAEPAIDFLLDRLETLPRPLADPAEAATDIHRATALLDELDAPGPGQRPSRKPRTERLRHLLDERCQARFADDLACQVLAPLAEAAAQDDLAALEQPARDLRRLEAAGRRLGGGEHYERLLRAAARKIGEAGPDQTVERGRLVEILAGPEAALALLQG